MDDITKDQDQCSWYLDNKIIQGSLSDREYSLIVWAIRDFYTWLGSRKPDIKSTARYLSAELEKVRESLTGVTKEDWRLFWSIYDAAWWLADYDAKENSNKEKLNEPK